MQPDQFLDPIWRLNNLYEIIDKDGKGVPFRMNWAQQEFVEGIHRRNLILKARQLGMTTLCCLMYLDDCLFNPNIAAAVIAHKIDDAKKIFASKVKYPYDRLPDQLKAAVPLVRASADTLVLANNSTIQVSLSTRSGTVQWLHVSEYGKICAQYPDKAREIRTGAFPSAEKGVITIESTAEGEEGDFYERCQRAQQVKELSSLDYKFFFYPWYREPGYSQPRSTTACSPDDLRYFMLVEQETGHTFSDEQINWWLAQERELGGDMKREYPATPREAFEQALEGAIFADQIAVAFKHNRIGNFPVNPAYPVSTYWDLGYFDETAIWFGQDIGEQTRFVGYYENSGEQIDHYIRHLKEWAVEHNATFGEHYLPHDGDRKDMFVPGGRLAVMGKLGFQPKIVNRTPDKSEAVAVARRKFQMAAFDADACKKGLSNLKRYRKEWDERRGVWRDKPHHGPESNGSDAFLTWAQTNSRPLPSLAKVSDRYREDDDDDDDASWMSA